MTENKKEAKSETKHVEESTKVSEKVVSKEDYDKLVQAYLKLNTKYNNLLDLFNTTTEKYINKDTK